MRMTSSFPEGLGDKSPVLQHWVAGCGAPKSRRDDRNAAPRAIRACRSSFVPDGTMRGCPKPSANCYFEVLSTADEGCEFVSFTIKAEGMELLRPGRDSRQRLRELTAALVSPLAANTIPL